MIPPKKITVITALEGKSEIRPVWSEPHGCLQTVMDSPAPGFIRQIMLGAEGLQIRHHENWVVIPKDVLLALAEQHDPAIVPPQAADLQADAKANVAAFAANLAPAKVAK
jgi:hypothetical protein